jgi:murein tripeptide amidase MpaA
MKKILLILSLCSSFLAHNPLEKNNYEKLTSYAELSEFIYQLDSLSDLLNVEVIGQSVEGRNLYALKFSDSKFGKDTSKIKVLLFAQQHGNEQSGKEGALLLATKLIQPILTDIFKKIDLILIPQMSPDGTEINVNIMLMGWI